MTEGIRDKSYRRDWRRAEVSRAPELILVVLRCNPLAGASGFRPGFRRASEDLLRRFQGDPRTHLKGILRAPKLIPVPPPFVPAPSTRPAPAGRGQFQSLRRDFKPISTGRGTGARRQQVCAPRSLLRPSRRTINPARVGGGAGADMACGR